MRQLLNFYKSLIAIDTFRGSANFLTLGYAVSQEQHSNNSFLIVPIITESIYICSLLGLFVWKAIKEGRHTTDKSTVVRLFTLVLSLLAVASLIAGVTQDKSTLNSTGIIFAGLSLFFSGVSTYAKVNTTSQADYQYISGPTNR